MIDSITTVEHVRAATATADSSVALEVRNLTTEFSTRQGPLPAVDGVSFCVPKGRVLAVIGESGSGKSAMLRSIIGIQPKTARVGGDVFLAGRNLMTVSSRARERIRGRDISMVFQDPLTALDPVYTVERQLTETIRRHHHMNRTAAKVRAVELLDLVQIPSPAARLKAYPSELSGGMRQRVVIAMAIAGRPQVLLADEPTTALDVTVQARIIALFRQIQRENDMGVVVVTHDLGVAAELADDIAVMYAGRFVEYGSAADVLRRSDHPYTEGLVGANVHTGQTDRPLSILGAPPNLTRLPPGCAFAPRCPHASVDCWARLPDVVHVTDDHWSRCRYSPRHVDVALSRKQDVDVAV